MQTTFAGGNGALQNISIGYCDVWGVCTVVNDETEEVIATVNPFRYRCYYYDSDTGMYYLQSRYYDPVIGRFINADDVSILGTSETVSGYNLFAYCENDSINKIDLFGYLSASVEILRDNEFKIILMLYDDEIKNIKSGILTYQAVVSLVSVVLGATGSFSTGDISAIVGAISFALVEIITNRMVAIIDSNDHDNGANIEMYLKYGVHKYYYWTLKKIKRGIYTPKLNKTIIPYAYISRIPKIKWNKKRRRKRVNCVR